MSLFRFKQFSVAQERCAMKIGTDSTLLGAWAKIEDASHILDIGTGSGVLALMSAQRNQVAMIQAVEYEAQAFLQAQENISNSPWTNRIQLYHQAIQDFDSEQYFDAIISNPPFYPIDSHLQSSDPNRKLARSTQSLGFKALLEAVARLLCPINGIFSIILPIEIMPTFITMAEDQGLKLYAKTTVIPRTEKAANRVLMAFSIQKRPYQTDTISIRKEGSEHHNYTEEFRTLLKDFLIIF